MFVWSITLIEAVVEILFLPILIGVGRLPAFFLGKATKQAGFKMSYNDFFLLFIIRKF